MGASAPQTVTVAIRGPISRADLPAICDRVSAVMGTGADIVICDAQDVPADCAAVEALCRLQLAAGRHGCKVRLRHPSNELLELVAFMGLSEVLPDLPVEPGGQAEEREERFGLEEERELDNPAF